MSFESPKTEKFASAEEIKSIVAMREQIAEKIGRLDDALRKVEGKLKGSTHKNESQQLEELFNRLESRKKQAIGSMPEVPQLHPVAAIDNELREVETQMKSGTLRKDEREDLEQRFNKLEAAKKILMEDPSAKTAPESVKLNVVSTEPETNNLDEIKSVTPPESKTIPVVEENVVTPVSQANPDGQVIITEPVQEIPPVENVVQEDQNTNVPEQEPEVVIPVEEKIEPEVTKEADPVVGSPAKNDAEKVPVDREREVLVARARDVAKKIKNLGGADRLDPESQQFRNQNWGLVEVALIEMHQQEQAGAKNPQTVESQPGVPLEQGRANYIQKLIELDSKATLNDKDRAELAQAKEQYLNAYSQELAKIPIADKKARLEFAKKEADLLWGPVYAKQSEITQQRFERMLKLYGKKKPEGMGLLTKALVGVAAIPAAPIFAAQYFGGKLAEKHGDSYSKLMAKFLGDGKDTKGGAAKTAGKPGAKIEDKKAQPKKPEDGKKPLDLSRFKPVEVEDKKDKEKEKDKDKDKKEKEKDTKEKTEGENKEVKEEVKTETEKKVEEVTSPETPTATPEAVTVPEVVEAEAEAEPVEEVKSAEEIELDKKREEHKEAIDDLLIEAYEGDPLPDYQEKWKELRKDPVTYLLNPRAYLEAHYSPEELKAAGIDVEDFDEYPKEQPPWLQFMFKKLAAAYNEMKDLGGSIEENTTVEQFLMRALDEKLIEESEEDQVASEESETNNVPVPPTT